MKIKNIAKVVGTIPISDPYILGAYHYDKYPEGNGKMGPKASLQGKTLGNDFDRNADWRMYHGETIPGFPHHPHRGFEIITIVEKGFADHFDSKGSKGRYGDGDVQLMSAGAGVLHGEMFPLIYEDKPNPLQLFQIWINLPSKDKLTEPGYKMLWNEKIPHAFLNDENNNKIDIKVILGEYGGVKAQGSLEHSWAKDPKNHVGVAIITLDPNAKFTLPAVSKTMNRHLFFFEGKEIISIEEQEIKEGYIVNLDGSEEIKIQNGSSVSKILILEGEPINESVAAYGPFVMNTEQELHDAFSEYRKTQFGGWPWGNEEKDLVHDKDVGRFASYNFGEEVDKP